MPINYDEASVELPASRYEYDEKLTGMYEVVEVAGMQIPLDHTTATKVRRHVRDGEWAQVGEILAGVNPDGTKLDHETLRRKARIAAQMTTLQREMEKLDAMPREPREEESPIGAAMIFFMKRFGSSSKSYNYAAVKANSTWHVTGTRGANRRLTWPDLWRFIIEGETEAPTVWLANGFTEL